MTQQPDSGTPIPSVQDLKKLSNQELLDRLAQANYSIQEANRNSDRRVNEEKMRSKQEIDRLRAATAQHTKDLENSNQVLLRSLSRLQADLDKLQEENVTLRVRLGNGNGNGYRGDEGRSAPISEPVHLGSNVPIAPAAPQHSGDAIPQQPPKQQ